MGDEAQNLKEYAEKRCEKAFEAVVRQHAGMVFGTAYRLSGNRETAEEISQNVFTILARKASRLCRDGSLAGWLHRTTILEARNFMRKQQKQKEKMDALAEHQKSSREGEVMDHEMMRVLDEAINKLSLGDRKVILMRYFEGRSIREIAHATGKSEAASQKQSHRALQKLSLLLKRAGIIVPAGALAVKMVPIASEAVSESLVASISQSALSGAASVPASALVGNTVLTIASGKTILAGALASLVITTGIVLMMKLNQQHEKPGRSTFVSSLATPTPESEEAEELAQPAVGTISRKEAVPNGSSGRGRAFLSREIERAQRRRIQLQKIHLVRKQKKAQQIQ